MKLNPWYLALVFAPVLSLSPAQAADEAASPQAVVQALYHSASKNFGFTPETVKASQPWLTPQLYSRLLKKVNEPTPKGDAPDIDGDIFLNCQDRPDSYVVETGSIQGSEAQVEVTLTWAGTPGETRHYLVALQQTEGTWKVADVNYGKDGKLTDLLK